MQHDSQTLRKLFNQHNASQAPDVFMDWGAIEPGFEGLGIRANEMQVNETGEMNPVAAISKGVGVLGGAGVGGMLGAGLPLLAGAGTIPAAIGGAAGALGGGALVNKFANNIYDNGQQTLDENILKYLQAQGLI